METSPDGAAVTPPEYGPSLAVFEVLSVVLAYDKTASAQLLGGYGEVVCW